MENENINDLLIHKEKYVHLSANLDEPMFDILDHTEIAYTNVPRFTDKIEFQYPPYERETYNPELAPYDKH